MKSMSDLRGRLFPDKQATGPDQAPMALRRYRRSLLGNGLANWILLLPSIAFFIVFLVVPIVVGFYNSLKPNSLIKAAPGTLSLANYLYFLERSYYVGVLLRTLKISLVVTVIGLLVGYCTALAIRRLGPRFGSSLVLLLAFPILSGPIVTVLGWMIMFIRGGLVSELLRIARTVLGMSPLPGNLLGTELAVEVSLLHFVMAFVVLNILNALMAINPDLEEAAMTLGATPWQTFRHIIWPLSLPGVLSASLIAFSLCMNSYVNPLFLGGDTQLVMTTLISQFMLTSFNWQMASTTAVILVLVSLVIMVFSNRLMTNDMEQGGQS